MKCFAILGGKSNYCLPAGYYHLYTFNIPQFRGFHNVEQFYYQLVTTLATINQKHIRFDLSDTNFFPPEVVLPLICASNFWNTHTQGRVHWDILDANGICYLERLDVFSILSGIVTPPPLPEMLWTRGGSHNLLELRKVSPEIEQNNLTDVPQLLDSARDVLLGRTSPQRIGNILSLLSEISQNVTHSGRQGYVIMQVYQRTKGESRIHLGVADLGVGIPSSLKRKYPTIATPANYLKLSLEVGVSSRPGSNGLGLYQAQELVRGGSGILTIRSESAMLQLADNQIYLWDDLIYFPGTQVFITLWGRHDQWIWNYHLPSG